MALDSLIGALFGTAFGSPLVVGVIGLFLFIVFLVAVKISFEGAFALLMGFIHIIAFSGFFGDLGLIPLFAVLIIDGIIISIAFLRLIGRH